MSGFLGGLLGGLMPPITIGDVPLTDFAVPRRFSIGGEQELAVSKIPGGQLAVQTLGDFPEEFEIDGVFQGPTRDTDALQFEVMRKAGVPVQLIGMGISLTVIIRGFRRIYETGWITYRMALLIIPDPPAQSDLSGAGALADSVSSDTGSAQNSIANAAGAVGNSLIADGTLQNVGLGNLATAQTTSFAQTAVSMQDLSTLNAAATLANPIGGAIGFPEGSDIPVASSSVISASGPTTINAGLDSNAAVGNAIGAGDAAEVSLAATQTTIEGGIGQANGLFAGGWSSALPLAAQAGPALLYSVGAAGALAGTMAAAGFVARAAFNLANAAALPPPSLPPQSAPGQIVTLP